MKTMSGRTCLILALLSLSLAAAAVSVGLKARYDGVTVQAHTAGMQLQSSPEADEASAEPDVDEGQADKAMTCARRASHGLPPKQELAFAPFEDRQTHEGKTSLVHGDELPPKSKASNETARAQSHKTSSTKNRRALP
jgi:hypothetical protein